MNSVFSAKKNSNFRMSLSRNASSCATVIGSLSFGDSIAATSASSTSARFTNQWITTLR